MTLYIPYFLLITLKDHQSTFYLSNLTHQNIEIRLADIGMALLSLLECAHDKTHIDH